MSNKIITVENLSFAYSIYKHPGDIALELVTGKNRHDQFWALKNVSFSLNEKQRLGVIGSNGSGKSTLLKIITGHMLPTSGKVTVDGSISAMLSLNTVLNPEETGISNIRFNLLLNGTVKSEVDTLVEEIVEFTELGPFIYSPVKTYSSGMNAKLAFAINTAIKPEILIIDEVLSVGDAYFMGKATQRMIDLCNKGKGLVFVSHSNSAIQMLCDQVLWLDNGEVKMYGPVDVVTKAYEADYRKQEDIRTRAENAKKYFQSAGKVTPEEMHSNKIYRIRIVADNDRNIFEDTHYVTNLTLLHSGRVSSDISLIDDTCSTSQKSIIEPSLDVLNSEWGRVYNKDGIECRLLSNRTGRNKGGQVILPGSMFMENECNMQMTFESKSLLGKESLKLEYLDLNNGEWAPAKKVDSQILSDGWIRSVCSFDLVEVEDEKYKDSLQRLKQQQLPDAEIDSVQLLVNSVESYVVKEQTPFTIRVAVKINRHIPDLDVGIKIIRADGVYYFWQSTGLVGQKLMNVGSDILVDFLFDMNHLPASEYQVSAYTANGWHYPENYPYSEVYERKVAALTFTVAKEFEELDFGALNVRTPVIVKKNKY
jgi:lipopolysaccharide transport system ATP-binding protein